MPAERALSQAHLMALQHLREAEVARFEPTEARLEEIDRLIEEIRGRRTEEGPDGG